MNYLFFTKAPFRRWDFITLGFLMIAVVAIFYPVWYTEYLYTDEATQVWLSDKGLNLTSIPQGRYLTYLLFKSIFSHVHTAQAVIYTRVFSLAGWLICLPAWYYITRNVIMKNGLPDLLAPLSLVYLVSMPAFAISIGWAACLEMFIACTSGLIAGYVLYANIQYEENNVRIPFAAIFMACLAGIVSLFTYQNGFSCFFIPFFIQLIALKRFSKTVFIGIGSALLIYLLYYLLFKQSLRANEMSVSDRGALSLHPVNKILFLFTRPLASAFHFTRIFNEKSMAGEIIYGIVFFAWLVVNFLRQKAKPLLQKLIYFGGVFIFLVFAYLPSLIVAENYASNRTLFAVNMMVFLMVAETVFSSIKTGRNQFTTAAIIAALFLINAWYNFRIQFLYPLQTEYHLIKTFVLQKYTADINIIYFIRPPENAFGEKYGIVASWDEFGVPSTAKPWAPEPLVRQIIFEKTGNRQLAEKIIVKSWQGNTAFVQSGLPVTSHVLIIDAEKMIATAAVIPR